LKSEQQTICASRDFLSILQANFLKLYRRRKVKINKGGAKARNLTHRVRGCGKNRAKITAKMPLKTKKEISTMRGS